MKKYLVIPMLFAAAAVPAQAQLGVHLGAGPAFSTISEAPSGRTKESGVGYFAGGGLRFGQFLFLEPGFYYQEQKIKLAGDGVGIRSFMVPVLAGVNFNLQVAAIRLGVGPTVTFQSGVGRNDLVPPLVNDDFKKTRFGYQLGAAARILFVAVDLSWQKDFTKAFENSAVNGDGKLGSFKIGLGVGI
jgi:hypothetical protein